MYYEKKNNINIRAAKIWLYKYEEKKKLPLSIYIFNFSVYVTWACSSFSFLCILPLPYKKSWLVTINLSGKAGEYIKKAKLTTTNLEIIGSKRILNNKLSSKSNFSWKHLIQGQYMECVKRDTGTHVWDFLCFDFAEQTLFCCKITKGKVNHGKAALNTTFRVTISRVNGPR